MSEAQKWMESRKCAQCGKDMSVLYPHLYRYKRYTGRGGTQLYFCSWTCFRKDEQERKNGRMERKPIDHKLVIQTALEGGDPIKCLEEQGSRAPDKMWTYIKGQLKKKDPETYEKLAKVKKAAGMKEAETPEGEYARVKVSGPIRIETETPEKVKILPEKPVKPEIVQPATIDGLEICGVEGEFGRYLASRKYNYFDFQPEGGEMCMDPEDWRDQIEELNRAMKVLGVNL